MYTTSLTARLRALGLTMTPVGRDGKRPVYEVAGLEPALLSRWSSRRHRIELRTGELVAAFEADHERPPTKDERLELAQQATLDTRPGKHSPRSEAEQRNTGHPGALPLLGRFMALSAGFWSAVFMVISGPFWPENMPWSEWWNWWLTMPIWGK